MEIRDIERLLIKYFDGETTNTEEKELKMFFTEHDVPAAMQVEKEMFLQLSSFAEPPLPMRMEERLNNLIDKWDYDEQENKKIGAKIRRIRLQWMGSIAASIILLLSVGVYLYQWTEPIPKDTCADVEEAYIEAQRALIMFSTNINKGLNQMTNAQEKTSGVIKQADMRIKVLEKQLQRINNQNNE